MIQTLFYKLTIRVFSQKCLGDQFFPKSLQFWGKKSGSTD